MNKVPFANCGQCSLRNQPLVLPTKKENPKLLIVGEAPGVEEKRLGKPFVGRSGELLRQAMEYEGLKPDEYHITNSVLCWPKGNATPDDNAIACCRDRLINEIKEANPDYILALGNTAADALMPFEPIAITKDHGRRFHPSEIDKDITVTFHPAFILRPFGAKYISDFRQELVNSITPINKKETKWFVGTIEDVIKEVEITKLCSYDIETTGLDRFNHKIRLIAFSTEPGKAIIVPFEKIDTDKLKYLFNMEVVTFVGQNIKFDNNFLKTKNLSCPEFAHDTLLMHASIDERKGVHGLKEIAVKYLNVEPWTDELLKFVDKKHRKDPEAYGKIPEEVLYPYAARDVDYTLQLYLLFKDYKEPLSGYHEIIHKAGKLVEDIEYNGLRIDRDLLVDTIQKYELEKDILLEALRDKAAKPNFNPNSPYHLQDFLYGQLKLPYLKVTNTGGKSTDEETLLWLEDQTDDPLFELLLDYKKLVKILGTYLYPWSKNIVNSDIVYPEINAVGTETGRFSGKTWMTIMRTFRNKYSSVIRRLFIPKEGYVMAVADYSQAELRVLCCEAKELAYAKMFIDGIDPHAGTADILYGLDWRNSDNPKEWRAKAKNTNFATVYGAGAKQFAKTAGVSLSIAQETLEKYWESFSSVKTWINKIHYDIKELGYLTTIFNRRRRFEIGAAVREMWYDIAKEGPNFIIQSTANDFNTASGFELSKVKNMKIDLIMHDSLIMEFEEDKIDRLKALVENIMTGIPAKTYNDYIPFEAEVKIGKSWGNAETGN